MKALLSASSLEPGRTAAGISLRRAADCLQPDSISRLAFVSLLAANGLLLAFLLRLPRRYWTSYMGASIFVNIMVHSYFGFPVFQTLLFTAGNTVEVLVAASFLSTPNANGPDLTRRRPLAKFVVFGVLLAPLVSSGFVQLILIMRSTPSGLLSLTSWFVGDVMGVAVMTPLVLAIDKVELAALFVDREKRFEAIGILAGMAVLSTVVFALDGLPVDFVLILALLLAIFRLGSSGSALGILVMSAPAVYMTERFHGAFALVRKDMFIHSFFILQCFLCVALILLYSVNTALRERDRLQREVTAAFYEADANAARDHITGLANRRTFDKRLAREWQNTGRERSSLALLMIDVDQFKAFNDHYEHVAGDECLRRIATILSSAPMRGGDLVARYGGEEFAIILPRATAESSLALADRIRREIADARLPHLGYAPGIVTVSVGVAAVQPAPGVDETVLVQRADRSLYLAKNTGRNRVEAFDELRSWS